MFLSGQYLYNLTTKKTEICLDPRDAKYYKGNYTYIRDEKGNPYLDKILMGYTIKNGVPVVNKRRYK